MGVHNVLNKGDKVLGDQIVPVGVSEEGDELGGVIMAALDQLPPGLGQLQQADGLGLVATGRLKYRALPVQGIAAGLKIVKVLKIYKSAKQKYFCRSQFRGGESFQFSRPADTLPVIGLQVTSSLTG